MRIKLAAIFNDYVNVHVVNTRPFFMLWYLFIKGKAVAQWLRCCATNRKVAVSIPDGVIGIFH